MGHILTDKNNQCIVRLIIDILVNVFTKMYFRIIQNVDK